MNETEIVELARWLNAIQVRFYSLMSTGDMTIPSYLFPMDVEFKLDSGSRKLYIKQARPY
jgi:phosphoenolpyruvate synthase/pyruvate phosphate dikinase